MKQLNISTLIVTLSILFACSSKSDPAPILTLLENGDMEAGSAVPNAWIKENPAGAFDVSWSTDAARSGTHSLKIVSTVNNGSYPLWRQTYQGTISVGKPVTMTVRIKGNVSGSGAYFGIRTDDSAIISSSVGTGDQFFKTQEVITGNFDWTLHTITLPSILASTKSISAIVGLNAGTTGTVYFDDVSLTY